MNAVLLCLREPWLVAAIASGAGATREAPARAIVLASKVGSRDIV